jgi:aconitate hydratase
MSIYDASMRYQGEHIPLVLLAGKEYGSGSSRDWAAKGTQLLGVKAVIAKSFERIHRSNLVGMGILPLQFLPGESAATLGLTGRESYTVAMPAGGPSPRSRLAIVARTDSSAGGVGTEMRFEVTARLDGPIELDYYRQGGILPAVLRRIARETT